MTRVRHGELLALLKALETLYASADMATLASRVTRCLRELFDCDLASFDLLDLSAVHWNTLVVSPALPDWDNFLATLQRHAHEHPIVTHVARSLDPRAIRISDLIGMQKYRQTGIYNELFKPYLHGMDRQLGFVNKPTETVAFGASINRRSKDFTAEQRTLMELLRPHLLQAYKLARAQHDIRTREATVREGFSAGEGGLCEIDPSGRLEWATARVEALLSLYFASWRTPSDRLPAEVLTLLRPLLTAGRKSAADGPVLGRSWFVTRSFGTLRIRVAAKAEAGRWQLLFSEEPRDLDPDGLAARFGLTGRQAETLFWIGQGKTNEEIGIILAVSPRTVEKHVERLLVRLGVPNRITAARMALGR